MALYAMADNNIDITASRDGAMYNVFAGNQDFVIKGIGKEMAVTYSGLNVTLGSGEAVICGRHVTEVTENESNTTIALPANSTGNLVIRFDLTKTAGNEAYFYATPTISSDNLNNGGTVHDMLLYTYTTNGTGVVTLTSKRTILQSTGVSNNGAASTIINNNLTANRAIITNASGKIAASNVTSSELNFNIVKNLGENYVMNVADFNEAGYYKIASLASSPVGNAPLQRWADDVDQNVGDYYAFKSYRGSANYAVLLLFSPRYNNRFFYGRFWNGTWDSWTLIGDIPNTIDYYLDYAMKYNYSQYYRFPTVYKNHSSGTLTVPANGNLLIKASDMSYSPKIQQYWYQDTGGTVQYVTLTAYAIRRFVPSNRNVILVDYNLANATSAELMTVRNLSDAAVTTTIQLGVVYSSTFMSQ